MNLLLGHLVAPDLRGHGLSAKPASGYRLSSLAADVTGIIRQVAGTPAVLVGHSVGAVVALYVAVHHGGCARALVLVDPPLRWEGASVERFLAQMEPLRSLPLPQLLAAYASRHPAWTETDLALRVQGLMRFSSDCGRGLVAENPDHSLEPLLKRVGCPTLILAGERQRGGALTPEEARRAAALPPQGNAVVIPGAGHSVYRDQPEACWGEIQGFLAGLGKGAGG